MTDPGATPDARAADPRAALERTPLTTLRGVGRGIATRLEALGLRSVGDLLFHLPYRYEDRTRIVPIGSLAIGDETGVVGEVALAQVNPGRRRSLVAVIGDGTGQITLRLFHFSDAQRAALARGRRVYCYGEVRRGPRGVELVHPEYRLLAPEQPAPTTDRLTPVYPATEGVTQATLRRLTDQALSLLAGDRAPAELLPQGLRDRLDLAPLADALETVHRPRAGESLEALASPAHPGRQRLAFEELLAHHLSLRLLRRRLEGRRAPALRAEGALARRFAESLPFELTAAQARVVDEIRADLERAHPMHRLVQGDVGSGKTVVAAIAALHAIEAGFQGALMAPTELLAEQHAASLSGWLEPLGVAVAWLAGRQPARTRATTLAAVERGEARVVVGTHALFQEQVRFARLGLVIVDEQHRFGVHQRLRLRAKGDREGEHAHQLIMTATPIPRTLAMAAYADLDTSVIDELPPGRTPVETAVISDARRADVIARVHRACRGGEQAYWVCTLVEESEALQARAAEDTAARLGETLPDLRVGLVHGRMKPAEKERVMGAFKTGGLDLLVATTVIEVGVDVPNASLMIVENAERLGLSQLHQLRGRVGRGARRSVCLLMYQGRLSANARERLDVMRRTNDGFEIAQKDLELRGPGEVLGTRQTGLAQMRVADLVRDRALLPKVEAAASELLADDPERVRAIVERWVGTEERYGEV